MADIVITVILAVVAGATIALVGVAVGLTIRRE